MALTDKQKRFCDEYLIDLNATQAAIRAGYSKKNAHKIGSNVLNRPEVKAQIKARMEEKDAELIATQDEILKYLTSVMRGESMSEIVVVEGVGDHMTEARRVQKNPDEKDRLKAAELLGKRYGLYTDKMQAEVIVPRFEGEDEIED